MNNINSTITFENPLFLLLLIPAILFGFYYYFKLPKSRRVNRNRIASMTLHIIVLVLVTLVFSGMLFKETYVSEKNDVIILVDASYSNKDNMDEVNNFIKDIIAESEDKHKIGIVSFANNNIYSAQLTSNKNNVYDNYINSSETPDVESTNISTALLYARDLLETPMNGRIVLLTDGLDTEGNVVNVAKSIANTGTRIDTVFFSPVNNNDEVKIESLVIDGTAGLDKQVGININVQSNRQTTATVSLYNNDELLHEETVSLTNGKMTLSVNHTFTTTALHELRAEIDCERDTLQQNNTVYSFVNISHLNNVLVVDGTGYDSSNLVNLIDNDYNLTVTDMTNVPNTIDELREYEEVILVNVSQQQLTDSGFETLLDQFVNVYGGGMLVIGGDQAFGEELEGTTYESMLPIEVNDEPNPLSLMVVVDASSSMLAEVPNSGGKDRVDVSRDGVLACSEVLKSSDYMGLIQFDATPQLLLPLTSATRTTNILNAINKIEAGRGTAYTAAINMAALQLTNATSNSLKHILFITDGAPMDSGYVEAVEALDDDITLSIVVIGESRELNMEAVEDMVEAGDGKLYQSKTGSDLSAIMAEDTAVAVNQEVNIETVTVAIEDYSSSTIMGIDKLPNLSGYYGGVKAKRTANTVLGFKGNPLYADWYYGNGRVGVFMADLNGEFSRDFLLDDKANQFLKNVVDSLLPLVSTSAVDIKVDLSSNNFKTSMGVTSTSDNYTLEATLISPSGVSSSIALNQQTASYYGGSYSLSEAGIYTVNIKKIDTSGNVVAQVNEYQAFSYSEEYNGFYNESICYNLTRDIAMQGAGELLTEVEGMFDLESQTLTNIHDPRIILMTIAIVCFLLDIAARKFKFKLPSDFINKDKKDKANL